MRAHGSQELSHLILLSFCVIILARPPFSGGTSEGVQRKDAVLTLEQEDNQDALAQTSEAGGSSGCSEWYYYAFWVLLVLLVLVLAFGVVVFWYKRKENKKKSKARDPENPENPEEQQGMFHGQQEENKKKSKQKSSSEEQRLTQERIIKENERLIKENDQLKAEKELLLKENEWRRARNNADDITLDEESAHPNIFIAGDKKSFTSKEEVLQVPSSPHRFDAIVAVLGSEEFSSGNHYWEVDISSSNEWDLGVAKQSIERKGNVSLSRKEGCWVLGLSGKDYWAKTDPWTRITVQRKPKKIGIYLSFQEEKVIFFNVADMSVMFEFKDCAFSESGGIYPFFKNTNKGTSMRICSVKEEEK